MTSRRTIRTTNCGCGRWKVRGNVASAFELSIDQPAVVLSYRDFFGNHAHSVSVSTPHRELTIVAHSLVERPDALGRRPPR